MRRLVTRRSLWLASASAATTALVTAAVAIGSTPGSNQQGSKGKPRVETDVFNCFFPDGGFISTSFRAATTANRGNPPQDGDVAQAFSVPERTQFRLTEIRLALSFAAGSNVLDVWILGDDPASEPIPVGSAPGAPDDSQLIESFRLVGVVPSSPGVVRIRSIERPTLLGGQRYWVAISVPEPNSEVRWFAGLQDQPYIIAERFSLGPWQPAVASGCHALRVTGLPHEESEDEDDDEDDPEDEDEDEGESEDEDPQVRE
jgi:hypothetical protein